MLDIQNRLRPSHNIQLIKMQGGFLIFINIHNVTALRTCLLHASSLYIARVYYPRGLAKNLSLMNMAESPIIKAGFLQVRKRAWRIDVMPLLSIHIAMQHSDMIQRGIRITVKSQ
ncbi:hypothetical protein D3C80_1229010 [compost metagenome]